MNTKQGKGRWGELGVGTGIHTLLCIKHITNENLPHGTANSTQFSVVTLMRRQSKKVRTLYIYIYIHTYIYMADSLCCTAQTNTTLQSNYTPIKFFKK